MTSQKSLKNNVNAKDFKRSLKDSALFPVIALVVLLFFVTFSIIDYVTAPSFLTGEYFDKIAQIFVTGSNVLGDKPELLFAGMTFCGLFMAIKSFYFLLSKKQINVYLSIGVTRTRLLINRILSAAVWLFAATFIPILIVYIVNIANFGITGFMTFTFFYFVAGLFISGLTGFAIGTFAMTISGNLFEMALTTVALAELPTVLCYMFIGLRYSYLRGLAEEVFASGIIRTLNPLSFVNNMSEIDYGNNIRYPMVRDILADISKESLMDGAIYKDIGSLGNFILPLVIWLVVSVVLLGIAKVLLNKRKAENAHSFGYFAVSRAIISAFAFALAVFVGIQQLSNELDIFVVFLCGVGISLVAWFAVQLVMTRKIKTTLKTLTIWVALVGVTALGFLAVDTGYFGTYNKLPEKEDIKSVSISFYEWDAFYNTINRAFDYVVSSNPEDIEMIIGLFDEIKADDGEREDVIGTVEFAIETKDGEVKYRQFRVFTLNLFLEYLEKAYNSDLFDAVLEYKLIGFDEKNMSSNKYYSLHKRDGSLEVMRPDGYDENQIYRLHYLDNQMVVSHEYDYESDVEVIPENKIETDWQDREFKIFKGDDFAKALYNDLSKMTFDEFFRNTEKPVAILGTADSICVNENMVIKPSTDSSEKYMYSYSGKLNGDYAEYYESDMFIGTSKELLEYTVLPYFFIYPKMTETIKCFEDNNFTFAGQYKGKIKEVYYTSGPISFANACSAYEDKNPGRFFNEYGKLFYGNSEYTFFEAGLSTGLFKELKDCINQDTKALDLMIEVYQTADYPLLTLDDTQFNAVLEKCVSNYLICKDNGRYVYVVYEDGTMMNYYLPEANISVLK